MKNAFATDSWNSAKTCIISEIQYAVQPFFRRDGFRCLIPGMWAAAFLAMLLICPLSASAHAPSDVKLSYLEKSKELQVTITHNSMMPGTHYIKLVEIRKNAERPMISEYKNQPDKTKFTYVYKLQLMAGDRVEVRVVCNIYGSWTGGLVMAGTGAK